MYTIIGGDGKEYGPATADQVRAWIAGGRANHQTKIKEQGTEEWKTIADLPVFSMPGPAAGAPPVAAAAAAATPPGEAPQLSITGCYERSWALLKANFWPLVGVGVLMTVIFMAIGATHFLGLFASPLLGGVLSGGWYYFFLLKIRGQPTTVGDAFAGFTRAFIPLVIAGLLVSLFIVVGFFFLVIPGIYLAVAYVFTYMLAVDKRLAFWDAMETSRKTITKQWWRVLGLLLLGIPFMILGFVALGVGIFVAMPLVMGAVAYAYEDLCSPKA